MPLSADHASWGLIDLSADPINPNLTWPDIHRAKPRAPLSCRECKQSVHPKQSRLGHQFFAHDKATNCASAGESMAHRLLKIRLANAIRDAGWNAELEVSGERWRADILATCPVSGRRIAFEAQLASATITDLSERTARYEDDGVEVCWVSDEGKVWTSGVPSIVLQGDSITAGLGASRARGCGGGCYAPIAGCPEHAEWSPVTLELQPFLRGLFAGSVFVYRHDRSTTVWTTRPHVHRVDELARRAEAFEMRRRAALDEQAAHRERIRALLERQQRLLRPAIEFIFHRDGIYVREESITPEWAMGVPLTFKGRPVAVICPVASRITPRLARRLLSLTVFASTAAEMQRLAKACDRQQRIQLLEAGGTPMETPAQREPPKHADRPTDAPAAQIILESGLRT
ncbi:MULTISPECIES: competence protein CoiA [unclassified Aeromicrobium]|uniref:competence protein CoiA n=1 Tax=unclassified Aeromicrobium TaxID=2633570 RepID=UPI00396B2D49